MYCEEDTIVSNNKQFKTGFIVILEIAVHCAKNLTILILNKFVYKC